MSNMKKASSIALLCAGLSGCYVVPIHHPTSHHPSHAATPMATPVQLPVLTARLYPVNDSAAAIGRLSGTISRPERGHGIFSLMAGGETFSGEATRAPSSSKGTANAAGNRGGFIKCEYTMTTSTLGSGICAFSNGARFDMHISG